MSAYLNLPPGCTLSMIPGFGPDDEERQLAWEQFVYDEEMQERAEEQFYFHEETNMVQWQVMYEEMKREAIVNANHLADADAECARLRAAIVKLRAALALIETLPGADERFQAPNLSTAVEIAREALK